MGSVHDVIEAFRKAPSNAERGTKFEQLMVRYFELDPTMAQQYDAVWRWIDWPERRGRTDTGIDLVARERDTGNYTAIQCKFYEPTHTLAKGDIDSFFTASGKTGFTNRVIISTTDRWGRNAEDALADQLVPVQRIGMAEIAESPIDWDIAWPAGDLQVNLTPAKRHELRPHQQQAIDAVFRGFAVGNDRGKLIMACGTGKTFTALKIAERIAADNGGSARILLLVGPALGCPLVDTVRGSRHKNMKELRPGSQGRSEVRILFAFDPARQAIMLAAGNKAGRWTQWYDEKIKAADEMFAEHLAQFEDTKPKRRKRKKG